MLIKGLHWKTALEKFSYEDKRFLECAVTGESFHPHNIILDERKLSPELFKRLNDSLGIKE
jgi:hypothetical protein